MTARAESPAPAPRWIAMQRWMVLIGVAAACHAGRGGPAPTTHNTAMPATPAGLMTGLFAADRTLIYDVTSESSYWDDQDPAADANGNVVSTSTEPVTCHVVVGALGRYRTAAFTCPTPADGHIDPPIFEQLARTYVTDGERLWRLEAGESPTTVAALEAALPDEPALVVDQRPVDRNSNATDDDDGDGNPDDGPNDDQFGTSLTITAAGDGWCVAEDGWGGDEGGTGWCLSAARGITAASWYFAGGSSREQRAELRP